MAMFRLLRPRADAMLLSGMQPWPTYAPAAATSSTSWPSLLPLASAGGSANLSQARHKVHVPEKLLTKRASRSSGPGGQSVNMNNTRVQLSFKVDEAHWIEPKVREKMKQIHKNRINKQGEFSVACQVTSSHINNQRIAVEMISDLIEEAQKAVENDDWEENHKLPFEEWVVQKKIREGREKEIEKRAEGIKRMKRESKERARG
eukprot:CAMPEP_0178416002 /NCGR_PEP_ID=MMETSP0689_2-20121128/23838_1 /TAXON_ID=160604 /ORGANISM="Amphidinium massartii, Strain CS-259" /LENGTH=203 /DNA_ID=CAMNT_0020037331 /DNA_START=69 /DNA_END=676 /DNA_ORIENTATION=+